MASASDALPASPFTPAATRGEVALRVATYNVGAKMDTMFTGPRRAVFEAKLVADLQLIASRADVIGLQEVAPFWHNFISENVLGNWTSASILADGIVTFVSPSWTLVGTPQSLDVFPGETSLYRNWRKWLQA
jgi:hypothetical protein